MLGRDFDSDEGPTLLTLWRRAPLFVKACCVTAMLFACLLAYARHRAFRELEFSGHVGGANQSHRRKFDGPEWRNNQTVEARLLFDHERMRVGSHKIKLESGQVINDWLWVDETPTVSILVHVASPPDPNKPFLVLRQRRYAINFEKLNIRDSLAATGGYVDKGETPREAAKREVLEELGLQAPDSNWIDLGSYRVNANRGMGLCYSFLVLNATPGRATTESDDLTPGTVEYMSFADLRTALREAEFREVKWASTVALGVLALMDRGFNDTHTPRIGLIQPPSYNSPPVLVQ